MGKNISGSALSKRELVNDDLVALLGDVVLVEKTVRMANLSRGSCQRGSCTVGAKWPPRAPVRLPPHQGLRLSQVVDRTSFQKKVWWDLLLELELEVPD